MEEEKEKKKVWLDCDPGHDDMLAIILAGYSRKIELIGISTVYGNQTVHKTTKNALKTLSFSGLQSIPVLVGQEGPLTRKAVFCPEIHGSTGLDLPPSLPEEKSGEKETKEYEKLKEIYYKMEGKQDPLNEKAVVKMFQIISSSSQKVTIVATGCLTNIALLLTLYPEIKSSISEIVLMGGSIGVGNINPGAEFNILLDPESAHIVFNFGLPVVQVPLEVTHTALYTPQEEKKLKEMKSTFSEIIAHLMRFFSSTYKTVFGFEFPPVHDPVAVFYLISPQSFQGELMRVDVDTTSSLSPGRTVCDIFHMSSSPKNVLVLKSVNVEEFWAEMIGALKEADKHSPFNKEKREEILK